MSSEWPCLSFSAVNGLMHSNLHFRTCLTEVTFWHLANVGTQGNFLSVYFTGNPFEREKVYDTVLTLFPMSGETVAAEMETLGKQPIYDPFFFTVQPRRHLWNTEIYAYVHSHVLWWWVKLKETPLTHCLKWQNMMHGSLHFTALGCPSPSYQFVEYFTTRVIKHKSLCSNIFLIIYSDDI